MNVRPKEVARRNGGEAAGGNQSLDGDRFKAESSDRSRATDFRSIASRRKISRQLDDVLARLDGRPAKIELPDVGGRCDRRCLAMSRLDLDYWAERGHCPCVPARAAVTL